MRTPITLKIKFKSLNLDQFIERYSVDVSRSGIFIRTKEPLAVGTQLKFEFQLQDASSLIGGEGTVVWTREHDPARSGVAPGMGVRFDKLTGNSQAVLDQILSEKQRRGDAAVESRFDAGVRASQSASGVLGDREQTPLPRPMPGLPVADHGGFETEESTRVMREDQARQLVESTRLDEMAKDATTSVVGLDEMQRMAAQSAAAGGNEIPTSVHKTPGELIAATRPATDDGQTEPDAPAHPGASPIEVVDQTRAPAPSPAPAAAP